MFTIPISAEQLILGTYSTSTGYDETEELMFDLRGFDFSYMNFTDTGWYFSGGFGFAEGEDNPCDRYDYYICLEVDATVRSATFQVGYDLDGPWIPFVSLEYSNTNIDLVIADDDQAKTSLEVGTWLGNEGRRFMVALTGVEPAKLSISIGAYTTFGNNLALTGDLSTTTDEFGSSWAWSVGLGYSF